MKTEDLSREIKKVLRGEWRQGIQPKLWDGHSAKRVVVSLRVRF